MQKNHKTEASDSKAFEGQTFIKSALYHPNLSKLRGFIESLVSSWIPSDQYIDCFLFLNTFITHERV